MRENGWLRGYIGHPAVEMRGSLAISGDYIALH